MTFNSAIASAFLKLAAAGRALIVRSADAHRLKPYRPERHYMRGPGPQWRAKHAMLEAAESRRARSVRRQSIGR